MKLKDYWRLAKISLAARKKSTRSTVIGISFSLIIIVPLLFAMIGINQNILKMLNANPDQLFATFYSAEEGSKLAEKPFSYDSNQTYLVYDGIFSNYNYMQAFSDHNDYFKNNKIDALHYSIHMKSAYIDLDGKTPYYEKIIVNDTNKYQLFTPEYRENSNNNFNTSLAVLEDKDISNLNDYIGQVYLKGFNGGFKGDGAKQVIVSKKYLDAAGLQPEDVYNQKISVYYRDQGYNAFYKTEAGNLERLNGYFSHYLFQNFKVVGIIDGSKYESKVNDIRSASMIVTGASYYNSKGECALAPSYGKFAVSNPGGGITNEIGYNVGDYKQKNQLSTEYVFPGVEGYADKTVLYEQTFGNNMTSSPDETKIKQTTRINVYLYVAKNYTDLDKTIKKVSAEYANRYTDETKFKEEVASRVYNDFVLINQIFTMVTIIGGIFGGVILFAALVNLFNSVKHSVDSRRNYLGVMKAIGAEDATIPKLYFFEVLRIFLRAYMRILIIGSAICFGIIVALYYAQMHSPLQFTISWVNIPIVMGVLGLVLIVVGLIYSVGCSYSLSKKPITELLEG